MWSDVWWKDWPCRSVVHGGTGDGTLEERRYYLQNWRNDVMELVSATGARVERYRYDAYGRPNSFSPGDVAGFAGGPDSLMNGTDTTAFNAAYAGGTGSVSWITDLVPDNAVNSADNTAYGNYLSAGWTGGFGLMSDSSIDNRKGFAGYEFDPVLAGTIASGGTLPVYHVRNRVLNCDTGKWMQKDPLGYADSMDLYEYCGSDPMDAMDAMGLCASGRCSDEPAVKPGALPPVDLLAPLPAGHPCLALRQEVLDKTRAVANATLGISLRSIVPNEQLRQLQNDLLDAQKRYRACLEANRGWGPAAPANPAVTPKPSTPATPATPPSTPPACTAPTVPSTVPCNWRNHYWNALTPCYWQRGANEDCGCQVQLDYHSQLCGRCHDGTNPDDRTACIKYADDVYATCIASCKWYKWYDRNPNRDPTRWINPDNDPVPGRVPPMPANPTPPAAPSTPATPVRNAASYAAW